MTQTWKSIGILIFIWVTSVISVTGSNDGFQLPAPVKTEMDYLEESYRILDLFADQVWSGWKNYKDFPIQCQFDNGLFVLIGHPKPPEGYELLPDYRVAGRVVHVDRRNMSSLELKSPFTAGGGIQNFGFSDDGKPIQIVHLKFNCTPVDTVYDKDQSIADHRVLLYVHEFFHLFQSTILHYRYGNLRYNPDYMYATYSCIEGTALDQAYLEKDSLKALGFIRDFLYAREMKIRSSMTEVQSKREMDDDLMEGTARYAEIRILELIRQAMDKVHTGQTPPSFPLFTDPEELITEEFQKRLLKDAGNYLESRQKCYQYGCAQALLLQRFVPGWQERVIKEKKFLYETLLEHLTFSEKDKNQIRERFKTIYGINEIQQKARAEINLRDQAFKSLAKRKGVTYVLNFKQVQYYLIPQKKQKRFALGLIEAYPDGFENLEINDIKITGTDTIPVEKDQLYYLKIIDTKPQKEVKPYIVNFEAKEGDSVYRNAIITTPMFTIKAPKIAIKETGNRVKFTFLSRVAE